MRVKPGNEARVLACMAAEGTVSAVYIMMNTQYKSGGGGPYVQPRAHYELLVQQVHRLMGEPCNPRSCNNKK